jgi:hypothetical protein
VGMPASVGVDAIVENLEAQFAMLPAAYAYEILNIASDGSVVMTERLDYIQAPDCRKPRYSRHGHIRFRRRRQDHSLERLLTPPCPPKCLRRGCHRSSPTESSIRR